MGLLGKFIDSLAGYCESVVCFQHTPLPDEIPLMDYEILSDNVRFVDLGPHDSIPKRLLRIPQIKKNIAQNRDLIDVMLIRGPSPLLPEIAEAFKGLPLVFLLVGDYTRGIEDMPMPKWRRELIRVWSIWNKKRQTSLAKKNLTIVNSRLMFDELRPILPHLVETRTTTLSENDFYFREDTCTRSPYRILYSGRMDRAKGLFEMVKAIALLVKSGEDVVLDLVGWPAKGDTVMEEIHALAERQDIKERVLYHGYKSVGEELFAYYKNADIYWVASRAAEGFPRTIWEAMAHSLPVIATRVGSIPNFIENHAVLVQPASAQDLAAAVKKLIQTPALRQELIATGRELAKENTLEFQTQNMIEKIEGWLIYAKKSKGI
jgi:glycosyltransferase involved in cell wall biosynthesis